jgi:hypothetical protein
VSFPRGALKVLNEGNGKRRERKSSLTAAAASSPSPGALGDRETEEIAVDLALPP